MLARFHYAVVHVIHGFLAVADGFRELGRVVTAVQRDTFFIRMASVKTAEKTRQTPFGCR